MNMSILNIDALGASALFRCDRCQAQAFVAASKDDLMLLFCGHHAKRYTDALTLAGWTVHDRTAMINEAPSVSATA